MIIKAMLGASGSPTPAAEWQAGMEACVRAQAACAYARALRSESRIASTAAMRAQAREWADRELCELRALAKKTARRYLPEGAHPKPCRAVVDYVGGVVLICIGKDADTVDSRQAFEDRSERELALRCEERMSR